MKARFGALAFLIIAAMASAQSGPPREGGPGGGRPGGTGGPGGPGGSGRGPGGGPPPPSPVVAALDANHDGVIDAGEIANAPAALRTLDKNGDGQLTREELRPPRPSEESGRN